MGCESCKNKGGGDELLSVFKNGKDTKRDPTESDIGFKIFNYSIRGLIFIFSLLTVPVIIGFVIYLLFKIIILNKGDVNLMPSLLALAKKIGLGKKRSKESDDYEDIDVDNPEEYEISEKVDNIEL